MAETVGSQPLSVRLRELVQVFTKLGMLGFGGPQAHIAMANDEAVVRRSWLTPDQFTDGLAVCEMLPGPASTQMGIYIGYVRAGQLGALVTGLAFITPAFLIMLLLSWAYFKFQTLPQLTALFFGVSPVMIAIILGFCWKLAPKAIQDGLASAIALAIFSLSLWSNLNVLLLFIVAGLIGLWLYGPKRPRGLPPQILSGAVLPLTIGGSFLAALSPAILSLSSFWGTERIGAFFWPLLSFFLKIGTLIFGGGLVIIPLLEFEVVERLGWLTHTEFLNGVAIGQLSPGPVVLTAAFVGYKVAGVLGALVATVGIFAPSFAFIMVGAPLLLKLRQNLWAKGFLKGVKPAVLGAIAAAIAPLSRSAFLQPTPLLTGSAILIGLIALAGLIRFNLPTWQLVLGGAAIGLLLGTIPALGLG